MIIPVGAVVTVAVMGVGDMRAQVISDGPPDEHASVWAITTGQPRLTLVVKKIRGEDPPKYQGMVRS